MSWADLYLGGIGYCNYLEEKKRAKMPGRTLRHGRRFAIYTTNTRVVHDKEKEKCEIDGKRRRNWGKKGISRKKR